MHLMVAIPYIWGTESGISAISSSEMTSERRISVELYSGWWMSCRTAASKRSEGNVAGHVISGIQGEPSGEQGLEDGSHLAGSNRGRVPLILTHVLSYVSVLLVYLTGESSGRPTALQSYTLLLESRMWSLYRRATCSTLRHSDSLGGQLSPLSQSRTDLWTVCLEESYFY
jgi:hypothetical protein